MTNKKIYKNHTEIARKIRAKVVEMSHNAQASHLASSLSCIDILVALLWGLMKLDPKQPEDPARDRLILSKGHAAQALYASLAYRGYFKLDELSQYNQNGGSMPEHPGPHSAPGVEAATGSLGHGLSIAAGISLAAKINKFDYNTYVVLGDGECNEGSIWEAALFASTQKLGNLNVVIDFNKWQGTGRSTEIMSINPFREKWQSFGWNAIDCDGHSIDEIIASISNPKHTSDKPTAVIAHTKKGKGVSFMEDDNNWHYRIPNEHEVALALRELGVK